MYFHLSSLFLFFYPILSFSRLSSPLFSFFLFFISSSFYLFSFKPPFFLAFHFSISFSNPLPLIYFLSVLCCFPYSASSLSSISHPSSFLLSPYMFHHDVVWQDEPPEEMIEGEEDDCSILQDNTGATAEVILRLFSHGTRYKEDHAFCCRW